MSAPSRLPDRPRSLADRLTAVRRQRFVGRSAELDLFRAAIHEPEPPFCLLFVHGPGGIGKTSLLGEFERLAQEAGIPVIRLDGRNLEPSPDGFFLALDRALGAESAGSPLAALARRPRSVLLLDTYETVDALDPWLREVFLPQLPGDHFVVIAGRNPPAAAWRTDPG